MLIQLGVQLGFPLEHRVDALHGGDADPRGAVEGVRLEVLDDVLGGEFALCLRDHEFVELELRLPSQVGAINQEQDAPGVSVLDQPVAEVGRGEGLARAGRHLNQGPRAVLPQRQLGVAHGLRLHTPEAGGIQLGHGPESGAEGGRGGISLNLPCPLGQRLRPVEGEDPPAACIGVVAVGKAGLRASGLIDEGQWVDWRSHPAGQPVDVFAALLLHLDQRGALGLGFDHPDRLRVEKEQVVHPPVRLLQHKLANRHAHPGSHIRPLGFLHLPAGSGQLRVDIFPGPGLSREVVVIQAVIVPPFLDVTRIGTAVYRRHAKAVKGTIV